MHLRKGLIAAFAAMTALLAPAASAQAENCPNARGGAQTLTLNGAYLVCQTVAATKDAADPSLRPDQARTVWFKWKAPSAFNGPVVVDLEGTGFDAILGVFEGASGTEPRNGNGVVDMIDEYAAEHINFSATADVTYFFMVAAYSSQEPATDVSIRIRNQPPENDSLAGARAIATDPDGRGGVGMNNRLASPEGEGGEPRHAGYKPARTLWFKVVARKTGRMYASTCSEYNGDTVVAVYSGSAYGSGAARLVELGSNDDNEIACGADPKRFASYVGFAAQQGQEYRIVVGLAVPDDEAVPDDGVELLTVGYDDTLPTTSIKSGPPASTRDTTAVFEWGFESEDTASYECAIDAGAFGGCSELFKHSLSGLADGDHTFRVRAVDVSGNQGNAAEHKWRVDTTPPDTRITAAPSGTISSGNFSVAFDAEPGASYTCSLDNAPPAPCTSPQSYLNVPDGIHSFAVRARDALGNEDATPAVASFAIKRVVPPPPPVITQAITLTGTAPRRGTLIAKLHVPAPEGTKVVLRCSPKKRCPFKTKKTVIAKKRGGADLTRFVKKRFLRPGTVLELTITRKGTIGQIVSYRMRKGKAPRKTTFCVPPGGKPGKC